MAQFSCALIGCGAVATEIYVPILRELESVQIRAVCDRSLDRAKQVAAAANAAAYCDLEQMLQQNLDVAIVLTPPESHVEIAEQAMEAGCHVLIEKPFCYQAAAADRVIEKSRQTDRRFSVIHNERFMPIVSELKQRTERGEVGQICSVRFFNGRRDQTFVPERWYFKTYGGRLGETLPHGLYQLTEYFDDLQIEHVNAKQLGHCLMPEAARATDIDYDELFVELFSNRSKAMASISYSLNSNQDLAIVVSGTEGTLVAYPFGGGKIIRWSGIQPGLRELIGTLPDWQRAVSEKLQRSQPTAIERLQNSGHYRQIREFFERLETKEPFSVTPEKAREVVRLWEEIVSCYAGALSQTGQKER